MRLVGIDVHYPVSHVAARSDPATAVASDRTSNPEGQAQTATEESSVAVIDNTSPAMKLESAKLDGNEIVLKVRVTDALSPLSKAEGAVNADRWRLLTADDAVADALTEVFSLRVAKPTGPAVLAIRAVDASGNVAALSAEFPRDFK